jgi:Cdc6-like AAA superfamily ATPase
VETLASWFGLKDGHKDFFVANDADARLLFARQELDSQLDAILRKSFRTGNPPKFVLYGDWGVGKTHTLHHIAHVVENTPGYKARIVFVELPDINARDTFQVAHAAFLDALGITTVKSWMVHFQTKYQSDAMPSIQRATQSEDIAKAFFSLIGFGEQARISWDWLRGERISSTDARNAGLSAVLEQSNQFAAVLRMLGRLCADVDDKLLIFMLDEADKLQFVTQGDAINHWLNSFRILSDDLTKEIGLIVAASFRDPDDMPQMLADQQIKTRFGDKHYLQLQNFDNAETGTFVRGLLSEWVDTERRAAIQSTFQHEGDGEEIDHESFPFTVDALVRFVEYAIRNGGIATARDIQKYLDDIVNRAVDDNRHLISSDYLNSVLASV